MNNKNRLNCYIFSNLIVSILCFHYLIGNNDTQLVSATNDIISMRNVSHLITSTGEVAYANNTATTSNVTTVSVSNKTVQSSNTKTYVKPSYNAVTGSNIVNYAKNYLGLRYVSAGNSLETGTDCSGFTKLIYQQFGISLGRTVSSQIYSGSYVAKGDLQPGDLIFYGYGSYATHVAIYMGNGLIIHQSTPRSGVKISTMNIMVYVTARRVVKASTTTEVLNKNVEVTTEKEEIPSVNPTENIKGEDKSTTIVEDVKDKVEDNVIVDKEIKDENNQIEDKNNNSTDNIIDNTTTDSTELETTKETKSESNSNDVNKEIETTKEKKNDSESNDVINKVETKKENLTTTEEKTAEE